MKSHPLPTLTPLDQLLINVCDIDGTVTAGPPEWRFFLGYSPARELVVANAKGTVSKVRWMDVEGVAKRKAIIVRALTMQACSEREDARRTKEPYDPCWLPATVLMAVLDPVTQRIDGFHIRQPNGDELMCAGPDVIQVDDYVRIVQIALEGAMPVFAPVPSVPLCARPEEFGCRTRGEAGYDRHLEALIAAESRTGSQPAPPPQYVAENREARKAPVEKHHYRAAGRALSGKGSGRNI